MSPLSIASALVSRRNLVLEAEMLPVTGRRVPSRSQSLFFLKTVISVLLLGAVLIAVAYRYGASDILAYLHQLSPMVVGLVAFGLLANATLAVLRFQVLAYDAGHPIKWRRAMAAVGAGSLAGALFFQIAGQLMARGVVMRRGGVPFGAVVVDVLAAAATKWNFLNYTPGLVGGHCIGVDPYYLTYRAEKAGYHPQVILSGRRINDGMGQWIAQETVRALTLRGCTNAVVTVLGMTFKEDVPDIRNSRVIDVVRELERFGIRVQVADPLAVAGETKHEYGVTLTPLQNLQPADAVVLAVAHADYVGKGWRLIEQLLKGGKGTVIDVKSRLDRAAKPGGIDLWRL